MDVIAVAVAVVNQRIIHVSTTYQQRINVQDDYHHSADESPSPRLDWAIGQLAGFRSLGLQTVAAGLKVNARCLKLKESRSWTWRGISGYYLTVSIITPKTGLNKVKQG